MIESIKKLTNNCLLGFVVSVVGVVLPFSVVPPGCAVGGACDDMGAIVEDGAGDSIVCTGGVEVCPMASANQT